MSLTSEPGFPSASSKTHKHRDSDVKVSYKTVIGISWIEVFLRYMLVDMFTGYCAKKDLSTNSQQVVGVVACSKLKRI